MAFYEGLAWFHQLKYEESIECFQQALAQNPSEAFLPDVYYFCGLARANLDAHGAATADFTQALKRSKVKRKWITYIHERAKSLQMARQYAPALRDFNQVIKHNPTNAHAHFRRAFVHKALGHLEAAADDFEVAKMLDPDNPHLIVNYKTLHDTECIILCRPGDEPEY